MGQGQSKKSKTSDPESLKKRAMTMNLQKKKEMFVCRLKKDQRTVQRNTEKINNSHF